MSLPSFEPPESMRRIPPKANDYQLVKGDVVLIRPAPVELEWNMDDGEFEEYAKAASQFLKTNAEFRAESFRRFLRRNNILVYSMEDISRLLRYKYKNLSLCLCYLIDLESNEEVYRSGHPEKFKGLLVSQRFFGGFVPLRIINRVNLVLKEFPEICCLVSSGSNDCSEVERFVVVVFKGKCEPFVIDMWDKKESDIAKRGGRDV